MNEFQSESLSALLDGEADELELRRILQSSETDPTVLETWDRYNLVHSLLNSQAVPVGTSFADKIAKQLAEEPAVSAAPQAAATWQQNITKMAIAASVAIVFIVGLQTANQPGAPAIAVNNDASNSAEVDGSVLPTPILVSGVAAVADPEAQIRLAEFLGKNTSIKTDEPVLIEHIQDSPLYRLVNNLQVKPQN